MNHSKITDIENTSVITDKIIGENKLKMFIGEFIGQFGIANIITTNQIIDEGLIVLRRKYRINPSKEQMRYIYEKYYSTIPLNHIMSRYMIKKAVRSQSGLLVSTVVLKPDKFSCTKPCAYCPTETDKLRRPTQPKSYLSSEPAMLRAVKYNFDVAGQIDDKIKSSIATGNLKLTDNKSYKLEIILSGGTWEIYPYEYRNQVMTELYWAANTWTPETCFNNSKRRLIKILEEEITINETSSFRIVGLTIETRPDFITKKSIKDYRRWGVTRIQLGVQQYDDEILRKVKRECYTKDTITAIRLLKQTGYKIICHLMPDLPGSSPEKDKKMFKTALYNPDVQFDELKLYPTAVCKSDNPDLVVTSDIATWYEQGLYTPYAEKNLSQLIDVIIYYLRNVQPWVRIARLVRDIPMQSIEAGYERNSNLRQVIEAKMKKDNIKCFDVRNMEVKNDIEHPELVRLVINHYKASEGDEYYISFQEHSKSKLFSWDFWTYLWFLFCYYFMLIVRKKIIYWGGNLNTYQKLLGHCRLRFDPNPGADFIPELKESALIRELHVYGAAYGIGEHGKNYTQHCGYGKKLIQTAEELSQQHKYKKVAIIASVGTREYYKNKCGYYLEGTYMIKFI